jgi:hypothetical protein
MNISAYGTVIDSIGEALGVDTGLISDPVFDAAQAAAKESLSDVVATLELVIQYAKDTDGIKDLGASANTTYFKLTGRHFSPRRNN